MSAHPAAVTRSIKTPDQRLRVYVSGVQNELAAERAAAIEAIESLRLVPVFLDMAARSHAHRDLYRSYVQQSHIFVGIYWQSYGDTAPGSDVAQLEEELALAESLPQLIYVKRPAPDRQPRLQTFMDTFRSGDSVSYRPFESVEELRELVKDDLVVLLSERFEGEGTSAGHADDGMRSHLPSFVNEFVGRDEHLVALRDLLARADVRMITLTGPGGIGKSRLALELGATVVGSFRDGVHLVMLESVSDPTLVLPSIASALEIKDTSNPFGDPLFVYLRDRDLLLVLDNLEQVVAAGPELVRLLEECPGVKMLITSRVVLNLRGEHEYPVPILSVPRNGTGDPSELAVYDAVRLFVARARASDPRFELTSDNGAAVAEICKRLDGLPLALELAAARSRLFGPEALLARLDDRFAVLKGGAADLPERQRALRTTIAWSYDLLNEREQALFVRLGIFRGGWTFAATEAVCPEDGDVLDDLQTLLDSSLVRHDTAHDEPRFAMLETVREFAAELLRASPDADEAAAAHARFFLALAADAETGLRSGSQTRWLHAVEADLDNLRLALRWALDNDRVDLAARAGWALWVFWWVRSYLAEGRRWMEEVVARSDEIPPEWRTRASAALAVMAFWQADFPTAVPLLTNALEEFRSRNDATGIALCQLGLGFMELSGPDAGAALPRFEEARRLLEGADDDWTEALSLNAMGWLAVSTDTEQVPDRIFEVGVDVAERLGAPVELAMARGNLGRRKMFRGDLETAEPIMSAALHVLHAESIHSATAYMLDAFAELRMLQGDLERSARLFGAAEALRESANFPMLPFLRERWDRWVTKLKKEMGEEVFEKEWELGTEMQIPDAVAYATAEGAVSRRGGS